MNTTISHSGYGRLTTGGRHKRTVYVTNLLDYIASNDIPIIGSLRSYLDESQSNLYINFNVSGIIYLKSALLINGCNLTINGLSSPNYPGITISNNEMVIMGNPYNYSSDINGTNIIIIGLRFMNTTDDNLRLIDNAHNIIISYCSFNLAINDAFGYTEGSYNTTFSFNLIQIQTPKAILISYASYHISLHHNVFINSNGRNPQINVRKRYQSYGPNPLSVTSDIQYNIIWNFGQGSRIESSINGINATCNFINNLYKSNDNYNAQKYILALNNSDIYMCNNAIIQDCRTNSQSMTGLNITTINCISNHKQFITPNILTQFGNTNHCGLTQNELINEWKYMLNNSGLGAIGWDNEQEQNVKNTVIIPANLWGNQFPWNDWSDSMCC